MDPQSYFLTVADAWAMLASSLHYPIGRLNIHQRDYFSVLRKTPGLPYAYVQLVPNPMTSACSCRLPPRCTTTGSLPVSC